MDVRIFPPVAEDVQNDQELGQAQLKLVEQGVLSQGDFLPWAAETLQVLELGGRVVKWDLAKIILALAALNYFGQKAVLVK